MCFMLHYVAIWYVQLYFSHQAEKNAKKKARAKELKKLRKARQKKAQVHINLFSDHFMIANFFPYPVLGLAKIFVGSSLAWARITWHELKRRL